MITIIGGAYQGKLVVICTILQRSPTAYSENGAKPQDDRWPGSASNEVARLFCGIPTRMKK